MPADAYRCYLALKNHFTKDKYDYHKYHGKVRATNEAFYKRKDRFWFEKFARQKNDKEVEEFFVSNFIYSTDPGTMWIGEMIKEGEGRYSEWKRKVQSLTYISCLQSISATGANPILCDINPEFITTGNIGCITQIANGTKIPILHTVEIMDWYTGGPKPKILRKL